jgi:hypothetical protein
MAATETILPQESWIDDCQFLLKPTSSVSFEGSAIGMAASSCQSEKSTPENSDLSWK